MSEQLKDANFETGAVRSADVDHLDFSSMPLMGLLGVMAVAGNGGFKYGRYNYAKGIPAHVTLNHMAVHLIKYILGDRTEDHMSKVAWGAMVVNETQAKNPELSAPHMLGPGATLTEPMLGEMERTKPERDRRRQTGEFEDLFNGTFADMPEVKAILGQRKNGRTRWARIVNKTVQDYIKKHEAALKTPWRATIDPYGKPVFNGPPENGFRKPEPVVDPETAKQYASELVANMESLTSSVDDRDFVVCNPSKEGIVKLRDALANGAYAKAGFVTFPEMDGETTQSVCPETLAEWCLRNPKSADAIQANKLGLSGTGCPEPFASGPINSTPGGYFPEPRTPSHVPVKSTPVSRGGSHMGGCPPLP